MRPSVIIAAYSTKLGETSRFGSSTAMTRNARLHVQLANAYGDLWGLGRLPEKRRLAVEETKAAQQRDGSKENSQRAAHA